MSRSKFRVSLGVLGAAAAAASMGAMQVTPQDSAALVSRAKAIHERVITADTHNDISPNNFTPECNYTMRLTNQVNLPKMVEGGLDVSFMIVYVGQGELSRGLDNAYRQAVASSTRHALTENCADKIGLALTPDVCDRGIRPQGGGDRHRERASDRLDIKRAKEFP
jgi:membrane dipeptidase